MHIIFEKVMEIDFSFALVIILSTTFSLSASAFPQAGNLSFSAELIHRDSPNSPFFNASETSTSRLANAMQRSADRVNLLNVGNTIFQSSLLFSNGDYLMKISIGTPPIEILVNVATASDIIWIPCVSSKTICQNCKNRIIDSKRSSTFKNVPCKSYKCQITAGVTCRLNNCYFSCDSTHQGSCPNGDLAKELITLSSINGQVISLPDIYFICGNSVSGDFPGVGFVGLGHGSLSLISQMDNMIDGKFSYCLVPYSSEQHSKINFGWDSVVSGDGTVYTPLIQDIGLGSYSIIVEGISVGDKTVGLGEVNGPYIDTGTMFTYLPQYAYDLLHLEVEKAIPHMPLHSNNTQKLPLCYSYTPDFNPPIITMNFRGANVELGPTNTFVRVSEDIVCFAFAPSSGIDAIFGNWQQRNFLIGYDLQEGTISFKPTDCTNY